MIHQLPVPANWQDFEKLAHCLWMDLLKDPNIQMNGRQGQSQFGVDVYGFHSPTNEFYGIQCKGKNRNYGKTLTEAELRKEVNKAKKFCPPKLNVFILATTAPNDQKIQQLAREITEEHLKVGLFKVLVYGWDEIEQRINISPTTIERFYPDFGGKIDKAARQIEEVFNLFNNTTTSSPKNENLVPAFNTKAQTIETFHRASTGLFNWPNTLQVDHSWISRDEETIIYNTFDSQLSSTTVLLGDPGTGKSALLSHIGQRLALDKEMVLAIKADQLDGSIANFLDLGLWLGLPAAVHDCLKDASKFGTVYVLIDQMDTLSELVDVKTQRLSVLLNLIKAISGLPDVHVVASSRPFEFSHDARFSSINAKEITLPNLPWDIVVEKLSQHSIQILDPDDAFKQFLTRPSNLNFYLEYVKNNPERSYMSHIELYEDIWNNSLGSDAVRERRTTVLLTLANRMTDEAAQALPALQFDGYKTEINWLIRAGILVRTNNNKSIAFTHQTLQAFVWTRLFIQENSSVIEFILKHQDNLNIRPKLASVLMYLRDVNSVSYSNDLAIIFGEKRNSFRKHIQHLVVDCMTAGYEPLIVEANLVSKLIFEDEFRARICSAMQDKSAWFDIMKSKIIPKLMVATAAHKYSAAILLRSAFSDRTSEVTALVRLYWINSPDDLFNFVQFVGDWNKDILELAENIVWGTSGPPSGITYLFQSQKDRNPEYALKIAGAYFNKAVTDFVDLLKKTDENEHYSIRYKLEQLLEFSEWYELDKLAAILPFQFVESFWSTFIIACIATKRPMYLKDNSYYDCHGTWFHLSDEGSDFGRDHLSAALEKAMQHFAEADVKRFVSFFKKNEQSELLPIQRLLFKGLAVIAKSNPDFALACLLEDERRFNLGGRTGDHDTGTKEFITSLAPWLNKRQLNALQKAIMRFKASTYDTSTPPDLKRHYILHNRKSVYSLLEAIPLSMRSKAAVEKMSAEERSFGNALSKRTGYSGFTRAKSPMSVEQMLKAKDDNLLRCFEKFPDSRRDEWPHNGEYLSQTELVREFEKFATINPVRAANIMGQLGSKHLNAVVYGLSGIAKSKYPLTKLLNLIKAIEPKFPVSSFYEDAAAAINEKLTERKLLSKAWIKKLDGWMSPYIETAEQTRQLPIIKDSSNERKFESILWEDRRGFAIPGNNYTILNALTYACMQRPVPFADEWADIVLKHIPKGDPLNLWAVFARVHFPWCLYRVNPIKAEKIISALLQYYPDIVDNKYIGVPVAKSIHWASETVFTQWLNQILNHKSEDSLQLYGELVVAKRIIQPLNQHTANLLVDLLTKKTDRSILIGIAFAVKNLWYDHSPLTTDYIVRLLSYNDVVLSQILVRLLNQRDDLDLTVETNALLDALIANKTFESLEESVPFAAHSLLSIAASEPQRIAALANQMVNAWGTQMNNRGYSVGRETPDLITIAITIHNLGLSNQSVGLDLFERLLELDIYQAKTALQKIDGLPQVTVNR